MKKSLFYIIFICSVLSIQAQEIDIPNPVSSVIPPSPTAASLGVYGEINVGTYTGIPSISVPITQLSGKKLTVPISLNYHSALKLDAMAGNVGLGWSLSAGGVITRSVRGLEDNTSEGYKNNPVIGDVQNGVLDVYAHDDEVLQMANGTLDGEMDIYHFNILSYSGSFVIDQQNTVHIIPYQDLKIEPIGGGFKMTAPDGTQFTFDVVETTISSTMTNGNNSAGNCESGSAPPFMSHVSAWYLSKIEDANKIDEITFSYAAPFDLQHETGISATKYFDSIGGGDCRQAPADTECISNVTTSIRQLSSIESAYGKIDITTSSGREDSGGKKVDEIRLFGTDKSTLLRKWAFAYDYFTSIGGDCASFPDRCKRLKLQSVQELPNDSNTPIVPPHTFNYLDDISNDYRLAPRLSYAQDHWGFNNGQSTNTNLLPDYVFPEQNYDGANRDTDTSHVKAGLLHRIHYPTGGFRQIDFEANSISAFGTTADFLTASSSLVHKIAEVDATNGANSVVPVIDMTTFTLPNDTYISITVETGNINGQEWNGSLTLIDENDVDHCLSGSGNVLCSGNFSSDNTTYYLPRGAYTLTAEAVVSGEYTRMRIEWDEHVREENTISSDGFVDVAVGGVRVKRIRTIDGNGQVLHTQAYQYTQHDDASKSSGRLITLPRYAYTHREIRYPDGQCCVRQECGFSTLSSSSKAPLGSTQGSHVCYPEVTMLYGQNGEGGRSEMTYTYDHDRGGTGFPYSYQTSYEWKRGLLLEQKDYAADDLVPPVHTISNTYNFRENQTLNNRSLTNLKIAFRVAGEINEPATTYECTEDNINEVFYGNCEGNPLIGGIYFIGLPKQNFPIEYPILSYLFDEILTNNCEIVAYHPCFGEEEGHVINNPNFEQQFAYRTYQTISRWYYLEQSVETTDGVSVTTNYEYDALGRHTQATKITRNNSDGKLHQTRMTYTPEAETEGLNLATDMALRHMIHLPFKSEKYVQQSGGTTWELQGGVEIEYHEFTPAGTSQYLPLRYNEILHIGDTLQRVHYHDYNADGYVTDSQTRGYPHRLYTWNNGFLNSVAYKDWIESFSYYPNSRLRASHTAIDGQVVNFSYDGYQRLKTGSSRGGAVVVTNDYNYTYATEGSPNFVQSQTVFSDGTPSQTTIQTFDGTGRALKTLLNGVLKNEIIYDDIGRVEKQTHLPGNFVTLEYDNSPLNRVVRQTFPVTHGSEGFFTETEYSSENGYFKTIFTDENSKETITLTDLLGRTERVINADGNATIYEYDDRNNPTKIIPPIGDYDKTIFEYEYDARNRRTAVKIPGAGQKFFTYYDSDDLLHTSTDANGNNLAYFYDDYGREVNTFLDGLRIRSNFYDENGGRNVGKMTRSQVKILESNDFLETVYSYDDFGRLAQTTADNHLDIGGGQLGNDIMTTTYNHADWVTQTVRNHTGYESLDIAQSFDYDNFGRVTKKTHSINGEQGAILCDNAWNNRDQMTRKVLGGNLQSVDYLYNERGFLKRINQPLDLFGPPSSITRACEDNFVPTDDPNMEAEVFCGLQEIDLNTLLNVRFDQGIAFDCYNPCENTGGVQGQPTCTAQEQNEQLASIATAQEAMQNHYATTTSQLCDDGSMQEVLRPNLSGLDVPTTLYRIRLCNGDEIFVFEEALQNITGTYYFVQEIEIVDVRQLFQVTNNQGIAQTLTLEQLLLFVLEGDDITVGDYQHNDGSCAPTPPDCTPEEQQDQQNALLQIMGTGFAPRDTDDIDLPTTLQRVLLCDGTEVYLFADELAQIPGTYTILQTIAVTNAQQMFDHGTTITNLDLNDLFCVGLYYAENNPGDNLSTARKNGDISWMTWQTKSRETQSYTFQYDNLNRLTSANHAYIDNLRNYVFNKHYDVSFSYDANGNITNLSRKRMPTDPNECGVLMDELGYSYDVVNSGNQLLNITDMAETDKGFKFTNGASDYQYDANGNLTHDFHKGYVAAYNYLNLPELFTFNGGSNQIDLLYDAGGMKLRKTISGAENYVKEYCQGIEYKDGVLEAIYHDEGRVVPNGSGGYFYDYILTDHLGNTRVMFRDINSDGLITESEILSESNYYPFGLEMEGNWNNTTNPEYNYLFNEIERHNDFGLNLDMAFFRTLDHITGRWLQIDPKSESFYSSTPYNGFLNNPITIVDMRGDSSWPVTRTWSAEDFQGYQDFVDEEIVNMQQNGEEVDCADFACILLVRYAAKEGLEVEFSGADGKTKFNSSSEQADSPKSFLKLVKSRTNAKSIQADMVEIGYTDGRAVPGDMTNSDVHVNVARSKNDDEIMDSDRIPTVSGSLPPRIPKNSSVPSYVTFKRFKAVRQASQKVWNNQKAKQRKLDLKGQF